MLNTKTILIVLLSTGVLTACGGGGDDGASTVNGASTVARTYLGEEKAPVHNEAIPDTQEFVDFLTKVSN